MERPVEIEAALGFSCAALCIVSLSALADVGTSAVAATRDYRFEMVAPAPEMCRAADGARETSTDNGMWWARPIAQDDDGLAIARALAPRAPTPRGFAAANPSPPAAAAPSPGARLGSVLISNVPEMALVLPEPVELPDNTLLGSAESGRVKVPWTRPDESATAEQRSLKLRSWAAIVVDQEEGRLLYAKNPDDVRSIASITKLMTAMVVLDSGAALDEYLTISSADVDLLKGSSSHLRVGTMLTRRDMLKLALASSENRAAASLARSDPRGKAAFVEAMNRKAAALGMSDTHFVDPTGLNPDDVSTAYDLALMADASYRYPLIREFTTLREYRTGGAERIALRQRGASSRRGQAFHNSNGLVWGEGWDIGLSKTGYISEAGRCLVLQATIAAKPVIIVLLDALGTFSRIADANRIKRWIERLESTPDGARRM